MKKTNVKIVTLVLAAMMLISLFTACTNKTEPQGETPAPGNDQTEETPKSNINPAGQLPIVNEKVTISGFAIQSANISDMVNNDATIELENRTNIKLDLVVAPLDGYKEKRSILLSSGDYPDAFFAAEKESFTNEDVMLYGSKQQIFRPLNDLIDEYGFYLKEIMDKDSGFKSDMVAPDGNIYGLPVYEAAYHTLWFQKMWMNQAWLDKLGLELPETTEDLYNVLKAFKDGDPNGNGKKDEIPLTGAIKWNNGQPQHFLMNAFIYTNRLNYFYVNDEGKLGFAPMQDEWREGLGYMKRLYDEGLLDAAAFTQTMEQVKQLGTNPDNVVLGAVTTGHPGHFVTINDDPQYARHKDYVAVPPLKGPNGAQYATYFGGFKGAGFVITDKCENPEAAFRLADYLYSEEGALLVSEGLEGKTWRKAEAGELNIMGEPARYTRLDYTHVSGEAHNYNLGNVFFRSRGSEFDGLRGNWTYSQDPLSFEGYEKRLFDETKNKYDGKQPAEVFTSVFLPADKTEEAFQLKVTIEDYVNQAMVRFITGNLDIEKDWDSYIKQLENLNISKYMDIYGSAYDQKKAITGK